MEQGLFTVIQHNRKENKMKFYIQASNPRTTGVFDSDDETLDESVETAFLMNTEVALMCWSDVIIPLNYKYSISTLLADILLMVQSILDNDQGKLNITWPSNDFKSQWNMSWDSKNLTIDAEWETVIGMTEKVLNSLGSVEIGKVEFLNEWKLLLETVLNGLTECGYNESTIKDFTLLKSVCSSIEGHGVLYA